MENLFNIFLGLLTFVLELQIFQYCFAILFLIGLFNVVWRLIKNV